MKQNIQLFWVFFKIGMFTFGGGYAMLPLIERELVENKKWIDEETIEHLLAVSQSIPGSIAINTATLTGYKINKRLGAFFSTFGVILPSFLIILTIAIFMSNIEDMAIVQSAFKGIGAAVIVLIFMAANKMLKAYYKNFRLLALAMIALLFILFTNISPVFLIIAGGVIGILFMKDSKEVKD